MNKPSSFAPLRLPALPAGVQAYQPPSTLLGPSERKEASVDADQRREVFAQTFPFPSQGAGGPGQEILIYKFAQAWKACDVYIQPSPGVTFGVVTVTVYAVTRGVRAIVASGRYALVDSTLPVMPPRWIAAARSISTTFEITLSFTQPFAAPAFQGSVQFSCIGSDEALSPPYEVGEESASLVYFQANVHNIGVGIAGVQFPPNLELRSLRAATSVAAARYVMLFDSAADPANGDIPLFVWPAGALAGSGLGETKFVYRAKRRLRLVASSTFDTLTLQNDVAITAMVR